MFSAILLLLGAMACDDGSSKGAGVLEPPLIQEPGKTDISGDVVDIRGRISFGGEVFGEFAADGQLDGWFFTAAQGSVITVENTHLGTARALDSTLFLYGPKVEAGFYGLELLVFDDDSGYGAHAKIREFVIPTDGEYLIVLGTYMGIDQGQYRLTLQCSSGSCVIPCDEACLFEDPCSGQTCSEGNGCIDAEPDPTCNAEKQILVDKTELLTSEDGESDSFTVKLGAAPSSNVLVWVNSSNVDEGVLFPLKLHFCMDGYEETGNGCTPLEEGTVLAEPHWKREVLVTVTGVRDFTPDGDADYVVRFEVITEDEDYAALTPEDVSCMNLGVDAGLFYTTLDGLSDQALLDAMLPIVDGHRAYGYLGQNSARTLMFSVVDLHDGWVESLYSSSKIELPRDSTQAYGQGFNTEHTWPQSQFDKAEPMKSDLHHVFPTDIRSNSSRSSYDFGMTSNPDAVSSVLGVNVGPGPSKIYQVRPDRRGDIARAHFYMAVRYRTTVIEEDLFDDDNSSTNGVINDYEEAILRAWHVADPVDDLERTRNNRIQAYQGNRNPFVDVPRLVERISDY
jgi:endonuclease I